MVAVLNPIMSLLHRSDWSQTLGQNTLPVASPDGYEDIRRQGEALRQQNMSRAREEARVRLERQVEAMAILKNGVKQASAQVDLRGKGEDTGIGQITLRLKAEPTGDSSKQTVAPVMVDAVKISPGESSSTSPSSPAQSASENNLNKNETAKQLVRTLSGFYGIPVERVNVIWE